MIWGYGDEYVQGDKISARVIRHIDRPTSPREIFG